MADSKNPPVLPEGYDPSKMFEVYGAKGIAQMLKGTRKLTYDELY
jgi:hypothetical protein